MKRCFGNIILAADRLDGLIGIGLAKNADNLFGAVVFLLHEATP